MLKERERINLELEELHKSYTKKYNELHEQKLRETRELNDQKQLMSQQQRDMHQQNNYVRSLELERERILVKLEDLE